MSTTIKFLLFGALGAAAVLLLTTERGKELTADLQDTAMKNAKKWKKQLSKLGSEATDGISDLAEKKLA